MNPDFPVLLVETGLETIIHGAGTRTDGDRSRRYVNCLRVSG
jgi:hypothetical protein